MSSGEVERRRAAALDAERPEAVARQHNRGHLTARERVGLLFDADSFVEHGLHAAPAAVELSAPADGIVIGAGRIDGRPTAVVSYDYTALGATQGVVSHAKLDHILEIAGKHAWPLVIVAEGAGARPQEMALGNYGRRVMSFAGVAGLLLLVLMWGSVVPAREPGERPR